MDTVSLWTIEFMEMNGFMDEVQDNGIHVLKHPLLQPNFALVIGTEASEQCEELNFIPFGDSLQFAHTFKYCDWMGESIVKNSRLAHGMDESGNQLKTLVSVMKLDPAWDSDEFVEIVSRFVRDCFVAERAVFETYQDQILGMEMLTNAHRSNVEEDSNIIL